MMGNKRDSHEFEKNLADLQAGKGPAECPSCLAPEALCMAIETTTYYLLQEKHEGGFVARRLCDENAGSLELRCLECGFTIPTEELGEYLASEMEYDWEGA